MTASPFDLNSLFFICLILIFFSMNNVVLYILYRSVVVFVGRRHQGERPQSP